MYEKLMQVLGFPDSKLLREILEYLMSEEEATVAAALPGSIWEVAEKTGISEQRVKEILENLFEKGVVFPKDFQKREYFRFARDIIQLHDATLATWRMKDTHFAMLWKEFGDIECHQKVGQVLGVTGMKVWRVVPAYRSIKDMEVLPYENIKEMLKQQEKIAVVPCSCRNVTHLASDGCNYTDEGKQWHCIQLGRGAEYVIARGSGREITVEEALRLIDEIEEDGLVHTWPNTASITGRRVTVNCNCCSDCCEFFLSARAAGIPVEQLLEKSRFVAEVDDDSCIACENCVERCHFDAIEVNEVAEINEEKCFGCGVCVIGCDQGALKLKEIKPPEHIPP
jgi:ferredoxin/DNA-binding Lrp family transcriptional regulator